ncbi:Murein DD-endopeptidase MepM and murein hydrolase activator NlpD, contain LysM domain [Alkalithermobacter thermoalcaliphilus JW-YL-7 = DSM 7308]|uniref:Murein DD-endopeptidase MepM and murein hydrolase activator NlpD, contain LysM domain n=1 Tax=Alkalithermobacter thermoalcaliphilus JW-YL-7 = DSM 7308 TaxID=1121328 RepID=A0A150FN55_CLOPD|nr:Peptidase M23 [[Clostridium] paradoxum JW-YL-7 = DSM 7308]SHL05046.1 Murein DD-endopeptidase MepM and murein hydrolase activator NlpD, contain LysM domain [[Clostridium] paradoxum JW-YL-7 = DSM 7308]
MENNKNNKFKKILEKDSFYLVLFLCVCLVAFTAVWATKNSVDNLMTNSGFKNLEYSELLDDEKDLADSEGEIHLIKDDEDAVTASTNPNENLQKAKEKLEKEAAQNKNSQPLAVMPVEGKIIREFSDSTLSYSPTLEQWELHKAVDIKVSENTPVRAMKDGEVVQITRNSKHGVTVKIKHSEQLYTLYGNLSTEVLVEEGDFVKAGDVIGSVGNTSIVESKEGPHLHLEAIKDGKYINPLSLIK